MSKSKGNTVEPAELQTRYGTDAVRFTMAILAAPGNDIPLAHQRMDGSRAFATKLWNACRFALMRVGDAPRGGPAADDALTLVDRWILSRAHRVAAEVTSSLEQYRFDRVADAVYHFVWHEFCDWYIEMVKPDLAPGGEDAPSDPRRAEVARGVVLDVIDILLRLLHPFMPFITEELWQKFPPDGDYLAVAAWPRTDPARLDDAAERDMELLQEIVVRIRNMRAESNIDPARRIDLLVILPVCLMAMARFAPKW